VNPDRRPDDFASLSDPWDGPSALLKGLNPGTWAVGPGWYVSGPLALMSQIPGHFARWHDTTLTGKSALRFARPKRQKARPFVSTMRAPGRQKARPLGTRTHPPNPCVPKGNREDSLGLSAAMPQVTAPLHQSALKGRESLTIPDDSRQTTRPLWTHDAGWKTRAPTPPTSTEPKPVPERQRRAPYQPGPTAQVIDASIPRAL
jgi:hypothetical protein